MRVSLNGVIYTSWTAIKGEVDEEFIAFLEEWFNDKTDVLGHTSGSTGIPKEIRLNKEDMRVSARITNEFLGIQADSVLLLCLSTSYIAGKMMVVRALEAGALLIVGEVSSRPLKNQKGNEQIDLAAMVPMQVEESLKYPEDAFRLLRIRQLLIGGAPVLADLEKKLCELPGVYYATYGMTETVSHVALRRIGKGDVYFALGEVTFSRDERDCLVIRAPHLHTREFITNDRIELLDDRHFKWLGRLDHVINSGGIKFFPEVIENKIASFLSQRYFITSLPDERLGEQIVIVLEGKQNDVEKADLLQKLQQVLTPYEMPKEIFYLSHFYETTSGKVIRKLKI